MPEWYVGFSAPVLYLPDHPKAQRAIQGLVVNSDTSERAFQHAIRTTRGDAQVYPAVPVEQADPQAVADARSQFPIPKRPAEGQVVETIN